MAKPTTSPPAIDADATRLAACGVASAAVYFPGFHRSMDNDLLWGEGWTEWMNLRGEVNDSVSGSRVRHPRRGYYDIWDHDAQTLRAQAAEAKSAGVQAFMFYHYWFAHGRTALSRPLEDALLDSSGERATAAAAAAANANGAAGVGARRTSRGRASAGKTTAAKAPSEPLPPPSIGLPFFFSWANEPWERRRHGAGTFKGDVTTSGSSNQAPRVALIKQDYGGRADWEAHFVWMLRFFRHPEYVRVGGAPLLVIYDSTDFTAERVQPGQPLQAQELSSCTNRSLVAPTKLSSSAAIETCGGRATPLGCAAAEQYLRWYPQLARFLTVEAAYAYHTAQGERLGFAWPRSNPCVSTRAQSPRLLPQMLAAWQKLARAHGLTQGLHVLFTMNHQSGSAPGYHRHLLGGREKAAGESVSAHGVVQFLPTSLVAQPFMTRGWPWGANGNFYWGLIRECYREEMGMPASTNLTTLVPPRGWKMTCACLLRHVGSDKVEQLHADAIKSAGRREPPLTYVRGAFASWSNYPRGKGKAAAYCRNPTAATFRELMKTQLGRALQDAGGPVSCARTARNATASAEAVWKHLVLVNSWNEWGEQAAIEPSVEDGEALLDAHREAVTHVSRTVELAKGSGPGM